MFVLIIVLAFAAAVAVIGRRRRLAAWLGSASLVALLAAGCGLLPQWLAIRLQGNPPTTVSTWGQKNVIVLLGAGSARKPFGGVEATIQAMPRIVRAVTLLQDCRHQQRTCLLEISGGDAEKAGRPEADIYRDIVVGLGVPNESLLLERHSLNTFQNAQLSVPVLEQARPDTIVLVTSAMHLPRATLYFEHFGIPVLPIRADYTSTDFSIIPTSGNLTLTDVLLHEYVGVLRYRLYEAMGWNGKPTKYDDRGMTH
ncbi:YdcF family protein [Pinirhizobacter sp.]|jgi:uncharacterized SAM-binding protein YcdF (DUF218 family)|uniref:YdcF family protein n=1 Tax=Pinirhizobacter sp. TaxID=2950432 RepID=UPI002F3FC7EB